ncbi:hypothetical protein [Mucilaginibacter ginsenosidivorans]|uniref:RHS repeat protein n=1 Tax=Mucilaginibacter ginsenosidivorans TaxID=398053 RepID=A0A5B8US74_9SPHI|nr:hypothetical protein [Mucilaginibacter ginsenosidivorans]QEC61947.1 hypothetical protein FRZ54_04885 [Mucilaginibacter ginsenosidivorans]
MKKFLLMLPLLFLNWEYGFTQTPLNYVVSPETLPQPQYQNVGKNFSVDLFTGIACANVPLFDYSVDGLDLGIALNYNCKGIAVDQISSEVGLGWQLLAGGSIERTVNGFEDELNIPATGSYPAMIGIFRYGPPFDPYIQEAERDKYSVLIGGRSFDMVIDQAFTPITFPKSEILSAGTGGFDTVNGNIYTTTSVTDEKGNVFNFDKVDYVSRTYNTTTVYPMYRWLLTKITTFSGQVVRYKYTTPYSLVYNDYKDQRVDEGTSDSGRTWFTYIDNVDTPHVWSGTVTHLSEIDYPDGTIVTFKMGSTTDKRCDLFNNYILDSITVSKSYDNNVGNSYTYRFNYAYFNSDVSGNSELPISTSCSGPSNNLRLKLLSITKTGNDHGTSEPYYSFTYNSTRLPARLSPSKDWYGFYNGQSAYGVNGLIVPDTFTHFFEMPLHWCNGKHFGIDKTPNITYMQACNLTSILSGTGGETDFYYKVHTLADAPTSSDIYTTPSDLEASGTYDGLCIDKIIYKDGFQSTNGYATYFTFSNGLRFYKGGYFWYPRSFLRTVPSGQYLAERFYTNNLIAPFDLFRNSNHGYSNVSVQTLSNSSETISTTKYQFTNIVNEVTGRSRLAYDQTHYYNSAFGRDSFETAELGLLMKKEQYDLYGHLLQKDTFQYDASDIPADYTMNTRYTSFYELGTSRYDRDTAVISRRYQPFETRMYRLKYLTSTIYSNGKSQILNYQYDHDAADNLTNVRWTDSRGVHFNKFYRYSYNYVFSSPSGPVYYLPGLQFLTTTELLEHSTGVDSAISIQTIKGVQNPIGLTFPYKFKSTSAVPFWADNVQDGQIIQAGTIFYPDLVLLASQSTTYDDHNNVLETKYLNQEKYSSAIWDSRIGQKAAEATNAKYRDIAYSSFEGQFLASGTDYNKGNWTFNPSFVTFVPYTASIQPITGRYYFHLSSSTGAITSSNTLTNGKQYILSFWAVDLPTVTNGGAGVTLTQQATKGSWHLYTALITGSNSTISISYPTVTDIDELRLWPADAMMTTYTYDPLFGVTSICDEQNNIIYQNYDRFGRQTATRDINGNVITLNRTIIHGSDN